MFYSIFYFFWKKTKKIAKKPKRYVLDVFTSLSTSFSTCSVVNAFFESTLIYIYDAHDALICYVML
jgi:hypothetical protein